MSRPSITVEQLGKRYRIGARQTAYRSMREKVADRLRAGEQAERERTIWALHDVSFEIGRGEAIGVIGANGAGKTTLLKILSRITEPTRGKAIVRGRVGSLLEVGTGFHPELTGRENIFLNGAILGMKRTEIGRKFDEIVGFAEVERFINTPVKRYSSGMYVRLAFSVAAHLDCDILLVDEVLSVGDFGFQRRCLGKIQEQTAGEGRTVLFVSHNIGAVKMLTDRCIWLERGGVREDGPTEEVFRKYVLSYGDEAGGGAVDLSDPAKGRPPKAFAREVTFESVELCNGEGQATDIHFEGDPITLRLRVRTRAALRQVRLELICRVRTIEGVLVFSSTSGADQIDLEQELYETSFAIEPNPLGPGNYAVELFAVTMSEYVGDKAQDLVNPAITFRIEANPTLADTRFVRQREAGLIRVEYGWSPLEQVAAELRA